MTPDLLKYMTTATWLRGYAEALDPERHAALIHKLNLAAELLMAVWMKEQEKQ